MSPWLTLAIAIVAEVIGTTALKASDGFSRLWPSAVVVVGYGVSFYCLSLVLRSIPVGITYAVWSGLGIVLISLVAFAVYGQRIDLAGLIGMGLIIAGVLVLHLFSRSAPHGARSRTSEDVDQLILQLGQALGTDAVLGHGRLPLQVDLAQALGPLSAGDVLDQGDAGVLTEDRVDRVDHEVARHLVLLGRALLRGRQTRQERRGLDLGLGRSLCRLLRLFGFLPRLGLNAALLHQLAEDGVNAGIAGKSRQILAGTLTIHENQYPAHEGRKAQGTFLDLLLTGLGLGKGRREKIDRHLAHGLSVRKTGGSEMPNDGQGYVTKDFEIKNLVTPFGFPR